MKQNPDLTKMTEAERAEWHEARSDKPRHGRVVKRYTKTTADAHLSVRLYPDQIVRLRQLADIDGLAVSALVRQIVEGELDRRVPAYAPTQNSWVGHFAGSVEPDTGSAVPEREIAQEIRMIA